MLRIQKDDSIIDEPLNDRELHLVEIGVRLDADKQPTGFIIVRFPELEAILNCDLDAALTLYYALGQAIEAASPGWKANTSPVN